MKDEMFLATTEKMKNRQDKATSISFNYRGFYIHKMQDTWHIRKTKYGATQHFIKDSGKSWDKEKVIIELTDFVDTIINSFKEINKNETKKSNTVSRFYINCVFE